MATYYQSPKRKGMDFWQAATGALLALFICVHLILEGSIVISPRLTDSIGWFLEYFWLAQIGAPVVVLLIGTHFVIAARKMPLRAGELKIFVAHSRAFKEADTWLWLVQVATAIVILVCAFSHVYTVMTALPIETAKSAVRIHSGWLAFHVVFLPCVILHTGIGLYRIAVKYGICSKACRSKWRKVIWIAMGCYLLLGAGALTRVWFLG